MMIDIERLIDEIHAQQGELRAAECDAPRPAPKASVWPRVVAVVVVALVVGAVWMGLLQQGSGMEENAVVVVQHQAPQVAPQPSHSVPATSNALPDSKPQVLPKRHGGTSAAATPVENAAHDPETAADPEPLLQLNREADGLCLANNAEIDCDDISQLIADLLFI